MNHRRHAILAGAVALLLIVTGVFAYEIAHSHTTLRRGVASSFADRATLTATLTRSLFATITSSGRAQAEAQYGGPRIDSAALTAAARHSDGERMAVLSASGQVLGASSGDPTASLPREPSVRAVLAGAPFHLSGFEPGHVLEYAIALPTRYGRRVIVTTFSPALIGGFVSGYLSSAPRVRGGHAYLLDATGLVIASGDRSATPGTRPRLGRPGTYLVSAPIADTDWHVVLVAPAARLLASVNGEREWIPWAVFAAFALAALVGLALLRSSLRAAARVAHANAGLAAANEQLARANRDLAQHADQLARTNAELEQFASIASHDLQEPLRKVRAFADQLSRNEADRLSAQGQDYLGRMGGAAERMQTLINDLLRFARLSTHGSAFADVDLDEVAHEAAAELELLVERTGGQVRIGPLPTIAADASQMRQLLVNLIGNGLKFHREDVPPVVHVSAELAADRVCVHVADNGIGFEPRFAERIFRVFERLHGRSEYPGTGIGLAICRKIVERHGGELTAHSTPGEGSTFTVTLRVGAGRRPLAAAPQRELAHV
ncbi:MAG TPA: ATP-binding protein [Solirubrobacteraceae bacterium]|jgi:signal transduction histidine kinase|nr:ATP-binding protein [Solirubrobacteraceae bacterium]